MFEKLSLCNMISLKGKNPNLYICVINRPRWYLADHYSPYWPIQQTIGEKLYRYSVINRWKNCKNLTWQFTCIKPNVIRSSDRFIFNRYRFFFIGLWLLDSMTYSFIMADKISGTCKIDPYRPLSWHIRYL